MRTRRIAALTAAVLILIVFFVPKKKPACVDCNVILITIDSVTKSHLSLYGYNRQTSPNLDRWAREGKVFSQYITTSDLTPITQTSIQTGLYPSKNGVVSFSSRLPDTIPTMAELLKKSGYETAAIGSAPEYFADGSNGWQARRESFERGFDQFFVDYFDNQIFPKKLDLSGTWKDYAFPPVDRGLPFTAVNWLKQSPKQKFYLWIPVGSVHWPYNDTKPVHFADPTYSGLFAKDHLNWRLPSVFRRVYDHKLYQDNGDVIPLSSADEQFIVDRYDDGIFVADQFLGELFQTLRDSGLDKKTIVLLTTEHGEQFGEHGYFAHYDIFDSEINTPLVITYPGVSAGRTSALVSSVDILPTIFDLLGIRVPRGLDGSSFISILNDKAKEFRDHVFTERTPLMETLMYDPVTKEAEFLKPFLTLDDSHHYRDVSVRTHDWKLIYRESKDIQTTYAWWRWLTHDQTPLSEYELYHLTDDPLETKNVLSAEPEMFSTLKKILQTFVSSTKATRTRLGPNQPDTYL